MQTATQRYKLKRIAIAVKTMRKVSFDRRIFFFGIRVVSSCRLVIFWYFQKARPTGRNIFGIVRTGILYFSFFFRIQSFFFSDLDNIPFPRWSQVLMNIELVCWWLQRGQTLVKTGPH